jgi:hypothetical protein
VVPARELNIPVVWVNRNSEAMPEGGVSPTYEVSNLAGLVDLLKA